MTLTRSVSWESIRVFTACNTTYWGSLLLTIINTSRQNKMNRSGRNKGGGTLVMTAALSNTTRWLRVSVKKKCSKQKDASFHYKESHCADYNKVCHNPSNNIAFWTGYNYVRRKSIYTTGNKRSYANFYHQQLSKHQQKVSDLSRGENSSYTLVSQKKPHNYWRLVAS